MTNWSNSFDIKSWAAWSPLIRANEDWVAWAANPFPPVGGEFPKIEEMQPINRRRLKRLGNLALDPAYRMPESSGPLIFCNKYGELDRCYALLNELNETGAIPPQSFSLAVHNAIPSLYTIDKKINSNVIAISSDSGILSALIEAHGLFASGESTVRIIVVEEEVPAPYQRYTNFPNESYGFVVDVAPGSQFKVGFSAEKKNSDSREQLSINLNVLRFILNGESDFSEVINRVNWQLRRS
jgi:Beta-ketoacyl synthase, N-terminal domain